MVGFRSEPNDRFHRASVEFARKYGVAVMQGYEGETMQRWIASGSISPERLKQFSDIYERTK